MDKQTFGGAIAMDDASAKGCAAIFELLTDMQRTFTLLKKLRMPVVAAIQGGCIGGAVDMVTACCLRCCSADAFFLRAANQHRHGRPANEATKLTGPSRPAGPA